MDITLSRRKVIQFGWVKVAVAIAAFVFAVWLVYSFTRISEPFMEGAAWQPGVDWKGSFYPAIADTFTGHNPYENSGVFNPPWTFVILSPIALLPRELGASVVFVLTIIAYGYAAYRLGAKPLAIAMIALSPLVIRAAINTNVDWLVVLGFVLPPQWGLFFILIKPQIGAAVALFWLIEAWRDGGIKNVAMTFAPVSLAFLLSFVLYGLWPLKSHNAVDFPWNTSMWPMSIPIGLALLVAAVQRRQEGLAISASPFLSPYLMLDSWGVALLGLLPSQWQVIAAIVGVWLWWLLGGMIWMLLRMF